MNIKNKTMLCIGQYCYLVPNIFLPTNINTIIDTTPYLDSLHIELTLPSLNAASGYYFDTQVDKLQVIISAAIALDKDMEYQKYIKRFLSNNLRAPLSKKYNLDAYLWLEDIYDSPIDWIGKLTLNNQQENIYFLSNFAKNKQVEGLLHNKHNQYVIQFCFSERYFANWQDIILHINNLINEWQQQAINFNNINQLLFS